MDDSSKRGRSKSQQHAADPTIVGGRPLGSARPQAAIPRGIEVLVKKASVDPEFREILLEKRASAAAEIGLELSAAEIAALDAVPRAQIEQIIDNTTVPKEHRRVFLGKMGAAMVAVLGAVLSTAGCPTIEGTQPHLPEKLVTHAPPDVRIVPSDGDRVRPEEERLKVDVVSSGKYEATANVDFDCPFDGGEVLAVFGPDRDSKGAQVTCTPDLALVSKGKGKIVLSGEGRRGTTEWLLVRLLDSRADCKAKFSSPFTQNDLRLVAELQPGEYKVKGCAIYRIAKFHKMWPA